MRTDLVVIENVRDVASVVRAVQRAIDTLVTVETLIAMLRERLTEVYRQQMIMPPQGLGTACGAVLLGLRRRDGREVHVSLSVALDVPGQKATTCVPTSVSCRLSLQFSGVAGTYQPFRVMPGGKEVEGRLAASLTMFERHPKVLVTARQ